MDRARRTAAITRRKTLGDHSSPQSAPLESLSDQPSSASPVMANASVASSPQAATQSRRGSKSLQQSFTLTPPAPGSRGQGLKRRSRTMDSYDTAIDDYDDGSPRKGGHTLRKRTRVDYTFEHVDDEVIVPSSTSVSRAKKRASDHSYDSEDFYRPNARSRRASLGDDSPSSVRSKADLMAAAGRADHGDDEDVQDTIEVGISYSDMEDSEVRRGSHSSASSAGQSLGDSWKFAPVASHPGNMHPNDSNPNGNEDGMLMGDEQNIDPQLRTNPPISPQQVPATIAPIDPQLFAAEIKDGDAPSRRSPVSEAANPELSEKPGVVQTSPDTKEVTTVIITPAEDVITDSRQGEEIGTDLLPKDDGAGSPEPDASAITENDVDTHIAHPLVSSEPPETDKGDLPAAKDVQPEATESFTETAEDDVKPVDASSPAHSPAAEVVENTGQPEKLAAEADGVDEVAKVKRSMSREVPSIEISTAVEDIPEVAADLNFEPAAENVTKARELTSVTARLSPSLTPMATKEKAAEETDATVPEYKDAYKTKKPSQLGPSKPQPAPIGRWAHLTPYVDGEYVSYPEKKARSDDEAGGDDTTTEDKDADKDNNDMEPMVEDNDDAPDPAGLEAPTPALNTPTRGSPVPDSMDPTATNSPAPAGEDADDGDMSDSQEPPERTRYFRYRKLRDPEEYITAIENYEDMSTADLYEILEAINVSLVQWQTEWTDLGKVVDDYENSLRRRVADVKYESRTRNLAQHGVNYEEPDFVVKGYKSKEKDLMSETRYLQGQDRIMAATYGFEYDPHPSKIGRQNPETQQVGIMTRGRSLRNQPKQTVKASEADEVTGKRQRKPVQLFDPATQDVSRSSTPVPTRGRRRTRNINVDADDGQGNFGSSFNGDGNSEAEEPAPKTRRRRGPRASNVASNAVEEFATPRSSDGMGQEDVGRSGRRRAARQSIRYSETYADFLDDDLAQPEPKQRKRHMLTLKIPRSKQFSEPSSAITDNGDSRPSTASSDSSSHTAESSYSFRPKRQKRFRDDPDEREDVGQAPPRKRNKRSLPHPGAGMESTFSIARPISDAQHGASGRKVHKIKVVRPGGDVRNGTPSLQVGGDGDDKPKDYKNMTKSEKMSASMKSRWANGNMAGAVEKRKATLAAKKAAQVAADSKLGALAPKPKVKPTKKEPPPPGQLPVGYVPDMPGIGYPFSAKQ